MIFEKIFYAVIIIVWISGIIFYIRYLRKEMGNKIDYLKGERKAGRRRLGKRCPNCKNIIDYYRKVCQHCGYEFYQVPEKKDSEEKSLGKKKRGKKCPQCGNIINYYREVCQHCGYKFPTPPELNEKEKKVVN